MTPHLSSRTPGDGAEKPGSSHQRNRYVYLARSRRAGGLSLGIDLTPNGQCSFDCVYCQASHPKENARLTVDVERLKNELLHQLKIEDGSLKDIVLAGSGEPTSIPNLHESLKTILNLAHRLQLTIPLRVFTNGRHFHRQNVREALGIWCEDGGQVWVKLDGAHQDTMELINGRHFDIASHFRHLWSFGQEHSFGIQTMLLRGPNLPPPEKVVNEVVVELKKAVAQGVEIVEVHLLTLSRPPARKEEMKVLSPLSNEELTLFAREIREQTGLSVSVFPTQTGNPTR